MGIDTKTDENAGVRTHTVSGEFDFEEVSATLKTVYADPSFRPRDNVLWDMRGVALTSFSSTEIRQISDLVQGSWKGTRAALVVGRDADYGMARMAEMQDAAKA